MSKCGHNARFVIAQSYCTMCEIERLEAELAALKKAIFDEPELPGEMPDEMWEAIKGDRDAVAESLRIAVRQTKEGILERATRPPLPPKEKDDSYGAEVGLRKSMWDNEYNPA